MFDENRKKIFRIPAKVRCGRGIVFVRRALFLRGRWACLVCGGLFLGGWLKSGVERGVRFAGIGRDKRKTAGGLCFWDKAWGLQADGALPRCFAALCKDLKFVHIFWALFR